MKAAQEGTELASMRVVFKYDAASCLGEPEKTAAGDDDSHRWVSVVNGVCPECAPFICAPMDALN